MNDLIQHWVKASCRQRLECQYVQDRSAAASTDATNRTQLTGMVGTDLERLVPTHEESDLLCLLVGKQTDISSSTLLPLELLLGEAEEFGAPMGVNSGEDSTTTPRHAA
jgi:hypothetical protein